MIFIIAIRPPGRAQCKSRNRCDSAPRGPSPSRCAVADAGSQNLARISGKPTTVSAAQRYAVLADFLW
ncbi:hypothetical protein I545_6568 [Mycobacterium kansasii 662]|nr:hypothetical protein I545_6568 [Mycobacterium kansasii 662]KEP44420.1 hypothetical protein MKSMC1_03920 [Mycobacterium kansasii]